MAAGLDHPWSLAFLPSGTLLVTERAGRLRMIRDGRLLPQPVAGVPEVHAAGQGGLFEVLPDLDFSDNRLIYLSFVAGERRANATRVVRARLQDDRLAEVEEIFTARPWKSTDAHFGGRMLWLPDGTLLLTVGDGFDYREQAQRLDSHLGSVVRLRRDGTAPDDNPHRRAAGARAEIYSHGHRNPQGLVHDAATGTLWLHDHGPRGGDMLHAPEPGRNYGWPVITYGIDYSGARITPYTQMPGMEQPRLQWTPSIAPAGMTLYRGALFPDWDGDLFISALAERSVRRLSLDNGAGIDEEVLFRELDERIRDVRTGPEGALYLLTDSPQGRVLRVTPAER